MKISNGILGATYQEALPEHAVRTEDTTGEIVEGAFYRG